MGYVAIEPRKLVAAWKYTNELHPLAKRHYANAYVQWLRNGAEGLEPERGNLSLVAALTVKQCIDDMRLWDGAI